MVDHGKFEGETDHITIPVTDKPEWAHMQNFLDCVRSRQKRLAAALNRLIESQRVGRVHRRGAVGRDQCGAKGR